MVAAVRLMFIHLDNSILVDAFTGPHRSLPAVIDAVSAGDILTFSTIVLYEWLRGPRTAHERTIIERQFAFERIVPFGADEAMMAARLYRKVRRARGRQADLAIAACAIEHGAALWTLNPDDFDDIPDLTLYRP